MSRFERTLPVDYFDNLYAGDPDPWRFAESAYEREKYAATLAALPRRHYAQALEIGCSIGVLTRELASRCDKLLSVDVAATALDQAKRRCADLHHVKFALMHVPGTWPSGETDLIVLSEVVYYLDVEDVRRLAKRVMTTLSPAGDILLVHWLGETHYPLSGDEAADLFIASMADHAEVMGQQRTKDYRLDVLRAVGVRSSE